MPWTLQLCLVDPLFYFYLMCPQVHLILFLNLSLLNWVMNELVMIPLFLTYDADAPEDVAVTRDGYC